MPIRFPYSNELAMPVIGLEAEFRVFIDDRPVVPEDVWRTPAGFLEGPFLRRSTKSVLLPTGGALYFDGGVIEVVTPVIELGRESTARAVRSLWEQIGFVRDQLDRWEEQNGATVRLQAFSCHINTSFEIPRGERNRDRTIQKLAVLLSHLLPVPVIVLGANRRSTGIGVRPRRDRIEVTLDFTPDPGLMAATTAAIVGTVRDVVGWPSYRVEEARASGIPLLAGLEPGPHPTRKGWVARAANFPRSPFAADLDATDWPLEGGGSGSLRGVALATALHFRESIRRHSDAFSYRLLFSVLRGETPSLLDLDERPAAYDDVGRATRWGSVLPELLNYTALLSDSEMTPSLRRRSDLDEKLGPPWRGERTDRRRNTRGPDRRTVTARTPVHRLGRSAYERVFLRLGSRRPIRIDGEWFTPVGIRGWYHAVLRSESGDERLVSIDQLREHLVQ